MKKCLCAVAILVSAFAFNANAQLQKGSVLIGGDLADFDLGLNEGGTFIMRITPKLAWFVKDNLALGGYADLGLATAKGAGTTFNYGVGGLGRYYFSGAQVSVPKGARFFAEANVGLEGVNTPRGSSTNGLGVGIGPGLAYFVSNNIALETLLKYNGLVGFGSSSTSSRLQLGFGFQIYLPGSRVKEVVNQLK